MLELDFSKCKGAKFKHEIGAQLRGIWPDLELSHCARDVDGMWMSTTLSLVLLATHVMLEMCRIYVLFKCYMCILHILLGLKYIG